jgi:hypothetical protein
MNQLAESSAAQVAAEVSSRISALSDLFEESLTGEMDALKAVLIENPSAAALLKDEDIGLLVQNLRRTVNAAIAEANETKASGKKKAPKQQQFTQAEIDAALAAEGF